MTELSFNSSVQRIVVKVPILHDTLSEGTEQFHASLSLVQSNGINVAVSPNQATVKSLMMKVSLYKMHVVHTHLK